MIKKINKACIYLCLLAVGPQTLAEETQDSSYALRANDIIRLEVFQEPDLSGTVRILKSGHASFTLIGSVKIGDLAVSEAAAKIRDLYAKDYLVDPKLTLTVVEYATDYISVIGAVQTPGQVAIPETGQLDLAAAMATTGGLSRTADANRILLVRASGETSTHTMSSIVEGNSGRIEMQAGDRIIVNQSAYVGKSVTILGGVGRQGRMPFPLDGRLDLVTAIAAAGGLAERANPKKITVNRTGKVITLDYQKISQRGDQPFVLEPDDIITVPEFRY